jgi:hypothetical protein
MTTGECLRHITWDLKGAVKVLAKEFPQIPVLTIANEEGMTNVGLLKWWVGRRDNP